jgi:hypothetical protein
MRAHTSDRVTSFVIMREMECAGVRYYVLRVAGDGGSDAVRTLLA